MHADIIFPRQVFSLGQALRFTLPMDVTWSSKTSISWTMGVLPRKRDYEMRCVGQLISHRMCKILVPFELFTSCRSFKIFFLEIPIKINQKWGRTEYIETGHKNF